MSLPFQDRQDAAHQLAAALAHYRGRTPLVLAIPRGGVPVGRIVAGLLGGELDVVLVRKLGEYSEVVERAITELMPHHVCTYLYELAQVFNRFYENCQVIGDAREALRISLVAHYRDTLAEGLDLLGIHAPEQL